jgi:hypothetical protein
VRDGDNVRELSGYAVWGFTGAAIAVPEIWAAVDSDHVPWPTISGTIAYFEYWHNWIAVIVIGVLVWAVFHSVEYSADPVKGRRRTRRRLKRTPGGRLIGPTWIAQLLPAARGRATPNGANGAGTVSPEDFYTRLSSRYGWIPSPVIIRWVAVLTFYVIAVGLVVGLPFLVHGVRPHDKHLLGEVLYGLIGFFGLLLPSVVGVVFRRDVPFPTFFWTIQKLESRLRPVAIVFAAGFTVLLIHLALYPWPSIVPDLKISNDNNKNLSHSQKKQHEPSAYSK